MDSKIALEMKCTLVETGTGMDVSGTNILTSPLVGTGIMSQESSSKRIVSSMDLGKKMTMSLGTISSLGREGSIMDRFTQISEIQLQLLEILSIYAKI